MSSLSLTGFMYELIYSHIFQSSLFGMPSEVEYKTFERDIFQILWWNSNANRFLAQPCAIKVAMATRTQEG